MSQAPATFYPSKVADIARRCGTHGSLITPDREIVSFPGRCVKGKFHFAARTEQSLNNSCNSHLIMV